MDRSDRELDERITRLESVVDDLTDATVGDLEALEKRLDVLGIAEANDRGDGG